MCRRITLDPKTFEPLVGAPLINSDMLGNKFVEGYTDENGQAVFYQEGDDIPKIPNREGGFYDRPNFDVNKGQLIRHGN